MSQQPEVAAVILAAGKGTRMKSRLPKVMHPLAGRPMVQHLLATVAQLKPSRTIVVVAPGMDDVAAAVAPAEIAIQAEQLGTGHAVLMAKDALKGFTGTVLVLYGDTPLLRLETLQALIAARAAPSNPAAVVLGFRPVDPARYGRLVTAPDGSLDAIVEAKDATPEQLKIGLVNSGVMALDGAILFDLLAGLRNNNAQGEYYLTDVPAAARARGRTNAVREGDEAELLGIDSRSILARAEAIVQKGLRQAALDGGATLVDPDTVWFSYDTKIGKDVLIEPNVFFGPDVTIADNVVIRAFSHFQGAHVASGATLGPFARLRPGAEIGTDAHIGNFVEVKNGRIEAGAKVNHLTYIGDARVGAGANVGAGTITANYDGFRKSHTDIGAGANIGSNAVLVAPVKIGDGAIVGAGSVIARDVPADALAVVRAAQVHKDGWAAAKRAKEKELKADAAARPKPAKGS